MQNANEIQAARQVLEASGLFSAIEEKKYSDFSVLRPKFRARDCGSVHDVRDAEKIVKEISEKIAPFAVGQGCAIAGYSDVRACRVIWTSEDGKRVRVQEDKATLLNGFNSGEPDAIVMHPGGFMGHTEGTQRYKLEADPEGSIHEYSLRVNGNWIKKGDSMASPATRLIKSHYHFYDYNF